MPDPVSLPVHDTVKAAEDSVAGSARTWLVGADASIVLSHSGVSIGGLTSKTMRA